MKVIGSDNGVISLASDFRLQPHNPKDHAR